MKLRKVSSLILALLLVCGIGVRHGFANATTHSVGESIDEHSSWVQIQLKDESVLDSFSPVSFSRRLALTKVALRRLKRSKSQGDRVVVFTHSSQRDQSILPVLQRRRFEGLNDVKDVASELYLMNEISFAFESLDEPWKKSEIENIQDVLHECYPKIRYLFGPPLFNIKVNFWKDSSIDYPALYFPSDNVIVLRDFVADKICHEVIHAFRDNAIMAPAIFEEGMTRAIEVEVLSHMPRYKYWNSFHSYPYDVYYEALNQLAIGSRLGDFFSGYVSPLLRYQLAGYAWTKVFFENKKFFRTFNRLYFDEIVKNPLANQNLPLLFDLARKSSARVEGKEFQTWYSEQAVLDWSPPIGDQLYQRSNGYIIDFFTRRADGSEKMRGDETIHWEAYDHLENLLDEGTCVTGRGNGECSYSPKLDEYAGRVKLVARFQTLQGELSNTVYRYLGDESGVFGVIESVSQGGVTITSLSNPSVNETVSVINGAFHVPALEGARGRFKAVFNGPAGEKVTRYFNKDAGKYFLLISNPKNQGISDNSLPVSQMKSRAQSSPNRRQVGTSPSATLQNAIQVADLAYSLALKEAAQIHNSVLKAANDLYQSAVKGARDAYFSAVRDARNTYDSSVKAANAAHDQDALNAAYAAYENASKTGNS